MRKTLQLWAVVTGLLLVPAAWAVTSNLQLVGLAVHQETGREIYLGAIHVDRLVPPPEDLMQFTGTKAMEYRVVARRTSIRSLLGSILLQAELASGRSADAATARFIDVIMTRVQGSLYAGDALDIALNENNDTVAFLNGHELARSDAGEVFDYLLLGWLGEKGASADFRTTLLAPDIDESLLAAYRAHEASAERIATIGTWLAPASDTPPEPDAQLEPATLAAPADPIADNSIPAAETATDPVAQAETALPAPTQPASEATAAVATVATLDRAEPLPASITADQPEAPTPTDTRAANDVVQLAAISPQGSLLTPDPTLSQALSLAEYSQRLAEFNSMIMRKVYSSIRYPKSAVRRNLEGQLELDLHLNADGSLREAVVARGSGHKTLDAAAIRAAENAFASGALAGIDEVAISEYGSDNGQLTVPVPVSFKLME
jgi:TonB family protein